MGASEKKYICELSKQNTNLQKWKKNSQKKKNREVDWDSILFQKLFISL